MYVSIYHYNLIKIIRLSAIETDLNRSPMSGGQAIHYLSVSTILADQTQ